MAPLDEDAEGVLAPTRTDPVARAFSEVAGGPAGAHARPHPWWTPVRVLLALLTLLFAAGVARQAPCVQSDWNSNAARYAKMCYSDIPYLYTGRGMAEKRWPYSDNGGRFQVMEYPVGISYFAWAVAEVNSLWATGPSQGERKAGPPGELWSLPGMAAEVNRYFLATSVFLFLAALAAGWFLAGAHRRRPWDALPFVLSPALLLTGLVNWDLLAVTFTAGALWAWSRGKPLLAGVMVGLGAATKLYPLFLLGAMLVVAWRRRRLDWFGLATGGAVVAWILANLPAWLTGMEQWKVFWRFNSDRGADLGSVWLLLSRLGHTASIDQINTVSWIFFAGCCALIALLGLVAERPPRLAQLGFLVVAAFLLVNKVYSPQYVLWLLPLAVLARPRWRELLIWQACEVFYFAMVWMYLGGWLADASGTGTPFYTLAIVVRLVGQLYLVVVVVRDILFPSHDPVRADGLTDDPMTPLPEVVRG